MKTQHLQCFLFLSYGYFIPAIFLSEFCLFNVEFLLGCLLVWNIMEMLAIFSPSSFSSDFCNIKYNNIFPNQRISKATSEKKRLPMNKEI